MLTSMQESLIALFNTVNGEASLMDPYDPNNNDKLADLDNQLKGIALKLQASGLQMDEVGQWVEPSDKTYDYTE